MKSTLFSNDNRSLWLLGVSLLMAVAAMVIFSMNASLAFAQEAPVQSQQIAGTTAEPNPANPITEIGDIKTFWSLTKLGGGISLAIFVVLGIGIFLIALQVYELVTDRVKGRTLLATNYRQLSVNEVNKLVMKSPNSLIARLYAVLLSIFHTTGNTRDFHDEIANYIQLQQDRFNTFKNRLSFLSDTAGALGLLGTVWGMFVTFFGGNLDSQRILNGMGLALVTTLIGLVVSIILNFFATEIFSIFNKRLELISAKADEFRLWLMAIVQQRNKKGPGDPSSSNGGPRRPRESEQPVQAKKSAESAFSLQPLSEIKQDGTIGQMLPSPIAVVAKTDEGKRVSGLPVTFEVVEGGGKLQSQHKSATVRTDHQGVASLDWTMGPNVGAQKLKVSTPDFKQNALQFVSFAQPFIPDLASAENDMAQSSSKPRIIS